MSESQSMGGIHYDVAMDVKPMLSGERQVGSSLDRMEGNFNKASKSIDSAEKSMLSFSKAALAVSSAISVGAVVNMVDQWGQVAARIKMALKSVEGDIEKYASIQERFLEISNRNGKAIEDTQLLYVGAATSMQELGYSTEQTVDYIESLSSSLTANAASANETQSMINALNKAMVSGKVAGENWNSIMNATPTLIGDIAKQLSIMRGGVKVTEQDVKKLAADGKISFQLFADAVIRAKEANNAMADSMDNTVADGFTKLTNSAKAYFGELNQGLGITRNISAGFAVLSENFDKVAAAAVIATAVIGARYVGALSESIKKKVSAASASVNYALGVRNAAQATKEETQALINNLSAEKAQIMARNQWLATQSVVNKQYGLSVSYQKEYQANAVRIAAIDTQMATAKTQLAAATNQASIANRIYAASANALRGGLALIGGPMGAATLAAGAIFYFYQKTQEAKQEALAFADSVDELKGKLKDLSAVSLEGKIGEASRSIDAQKDSISELENEIELLKTSYKLASESAELFLDKGKNLSEISDTLKIKTAELEEKKSKLAKTIEFVSSVTGELTEKNKDLYDAMNNASGAAGKMGAAIGALQQRIKAAADEKARLNNEMRDNPETDDGKKAILTLKEQNELLGIKDKRQRAIRKAEIEASKLTQNTGQAKEIIALATANYDLTEAERESTKAAKVSTKTTDEAGEALKRLQAELTRLNQGYAEGSLELAQYDAAQALGAKASPAQIALAKERAKSIWEVQAATKAATKAEEDKKNSQSSFTSLQESVSPVTAIDNQFAKQMEQINQYKQLYPQSIAEAEALRSQIEEQYRQKRMDAQWQELSNASLGYNMLTSAVDSFGGNASNVITGLVTGTMSAADAARSLGNTMLNSVVNSLVQVGVEMLKNFIIGQTMGSAAAAASAGQAALVATAWAPAAALSSLATLGANAAAANTAIAGTVGMAKGLAVAGARYNGGPVGAGQMYQVGEHGKPEIFKASTGKQYMIPGDNGRVISNKDMQGRSNGITLNIEFNDYSSGKHQFEAQASQNGDTLTVQAFLTDMQEKGPMHRSITQNTTATTRL
ncbi:tail length tape measure protein [Providencia alcalifaciens F90-2004]|uniref:tape measure protein n=1 Tax=Providencia alcalifaciens TaxID=126385 RepID=UPI00044E2BA6|nr:tape measure protein [Providencia alcalifaciens]ETT05067.1 tail length tape measure protein [Providencia alcalifaciens F90-2004]